MTFPSPGGLPHPWIEPLSLASPALIPFQTSVLSPANDPHPNSVNLVESGVELLRCGGLIHSFIQSFNLSCLSMPSLFRPPGLFNCLYFGHTHRGNQKGKRHVYPNVHRSTVYNSQDMDACQTADVGSIPGSGRSPRGGNGNTLQYSCLENSMVAIINSAAMNTGVHVSLSLLVSSV